MARLTSRQNAEKWAEYRHKKQPSATKSPVWLFAATIVAIVVIAISISLLIGGLQT